MKKYIPILALLMLLNSSLVGAQAVWEWQNPLPQGNPLLGIWGSSGSDVFAVGEGGTILHYDGTSWSSMNSGSANRLIDIWGSSGSDVFAVGVWGTILHYEGPDYAYAEPNGNCGGNGPCFSMIQSAIDGSDDGTLIKIGEGTYDENVVIDKNVILVFVWDSDFYTLDHADPAILSGP